MTLNRMSRWAVPAAVALVISLTSGVASARSVGLMPSKRAWSPTKEFRAGAVTLWSKTVFLGGPISLPTDRHYLGVLPGGLRARAR